MKRSTARKINAGAWVAVVVALMVTSYCAWSQYGDYTVESFLASLVMYGGFSLIAGIQVDECLRRHLNDNNDKRGV